MKPDSHSCNWLHWYHWFWQSTRCIAHTRCLAVWPTRSNVAVMHWCTLSTKNRNPVYVAITLANNVGFQRNCMPTQHWDIKWQTSHQISANRSTSSTATASLVRSLKSISVHYRHSRDWLSSVHPCEWQDVSTSKVFVQNVHHVSNASSKMRMPLPDSFIDDHLVEMFPLLIRSGTTLAGRRHESGCGTQAPAASHKSGSRLG